MRTKPLLQCSLLMSAAAVLALCTPPAQVTTYQQQEWLNLPTATSHVGNITGNAKAAAAIIAGTALVATETSVTATVKSPVASTSNVAQAARFSIGDIQVPLHANRHPANR